MSDDLPTVLPDSPTGARGAEAMAAAERILATTWPVCPEYARLLQNWHTAAQILELADGFGERVRAITNLDHAQLQLGIHIRNHRCRILGVPQLHPGRVK